MRRPLCLVGAAAVTTGALLLSACGSSSSGDAAAAAGPTEVHVTLSDYKVVLDRSSIPVGPVRFIIENTGPTKHEAVLEPAGVDDEPLEANGKESELEDIAMGTSGNVFEWTIDTPGSYQLACHITEGLDHYKKGMVATFTVT